MVKPPATACACVCVQNKNAAITKKTFLFLMARFPMLYSLMDESCEITSIFFGPKNSREKPAKGVEK